MKVVELAFEPQNTDLGPPPLPLYCNASLKWLPCTKNKEYQTENITIYFNQAYIFHSHDFRVEKKRDHPNDIFHYFTQKSQF